MCIMIVIIMEKLAIFQVINLKCEQKHTRNKLC